ncbi:hypothetical protein ACYSNM_06325 [Myroides sp. LJL116]
MRYSTVILVLASTITLLSCQKRSIDPSNQNSSDYLLERISKEVGQDRKVGNLRLFSKDILKNELGGFCVSYTTENQRSNHFYKVRKGEFTAQEIEVYKRIDPFFIQDSISSKSIGEFPINQIPYNVETAKNILGETYSLVSLYRYDFVVDADGQIRQEFILNAKENATTKTILENASSFAYKSFHFIVTKEGEIVLAGL